MDRPESSEFVERRGATVGLLAGDYKARALFEEPPRRGQAEALRSADDQAALVREPHGFPWSGEQFFFPLPSGERGKNPSA